MLRCENVSLVFGWELLPGIESELQRCVVRLQKNVRHNHFVLQFGMFAFMPRILMAADVPPGPAVKSSFLNVRDVIRNQVIAERTAFVEGAPQFSRIRIDGDSASSVADSVSIDAEAAI